MLILLPLIVILMTSLPATAGIGCVPPPGSASVASGGVVLVTPGGMGPSLAEQGHVIEVEVLDCGGTPVVGFPRQDIWLSGAVPGTFWLCTSGAEADHDTDIDGHTTISGILAGGGSGAEGAQVYLSGVALGTPALPLRFVSPDIDGNLVVDIADFALFGLDFHTSSPRSDLVYDGVVDLADFAFFARHFDESCP